MKKYLLVLTLAAMVLLAGCAQGGQGGASSSALQTTAPTPTVTVEQPQETPTNALSAEPEETTTNPSKSESDLPSFDTLDIGANKVDSSMLADAKLTMINFWGTYCAPCKMEMPDLGNLSRNMPEGSQLWGVVIDAYDEDSILTARTIVEDADAGFPHLLLDEGLYSYMSTIRAVPTTVFFDADGNQVGERIEGAMDEEQYRAEIEQRLSQL